MADIENTAPAAAPTMRARYGVTIDQLRAQPASEGKVSRLPTAAAEPVQQAFTRSGKHVEAERKAAR